MIISDSAAMLYEKEKNIANQFVRSETLNCKNFLASQIPKRT